MIRFRVCAVVSVVMKLAIAFQNQNCTALPGDVSKILSILNQNSTVAVIGGICPLSSNCCSSRTEALIGTAVTAKYQSTVRTLLSAEITRCYNSTVYDLMSSFIAESKTLLLQDLRLLYGLRFTQYLTLFNSFYSYLQQVVYTRNTCMLKDQFYEVFFNLFLASYRAFAMSALPPDTPQFRNCSYTYFLQTQGAILQSHYNLFSRPFEMLLQYFRALKTGDAVLEAIGTPLFSQGCNVSLARMLGCPYCTAGYGDSGLGAEPCMGMCLNVFRGCLVDYAELNDSFTEFVETLVIFSDVLQRDYSPWSQITLLENKFFTMIDTVYKQWTAINTQLTAQCNTGSSTGKRSIFHSIGRRSTITQNALIYAINNSASCLKPIPPLLARLPETTCSSLGAVSTNEQCWNGRSRDGYHKNTSQPGVPSQLGNPEVLVCPWGGRGYHSQSLLLNQVTNYMKAKLGLCSVDDEDCGTPPATSCDLLYAVPVIISTATSTLQGVETLETGSGASSGDHSDECVLPIPIVSLLPTPTSTPTPQAPSNVSTPEEFEPCPEDVGIETDSGTGAFVTPSQLVLLLLILTSSLLSMAV